MVRQQAVTLYPIRLPLVAVGQNLSAILIRSLKDARMEIKRGDVVALASKVVSTCEGRIVQLAEVHVSTATKRLAKRWKMNKELAAVVVSEADEILGGVNGFLLTQKDGILTANAGVDLKNSPRGTAMLWPKNANKSASDLQNALERQFHTKVGVEIVDSRVTPLRLGTTGLAVGVSGFRPVIDQRRKTDLYGRRVRVTQSNLADDVAAAAHMLMGETREKVGAVVVRNADTTSYATRRSADLLKLSREKCLIMSAIRSQILIEGIG